MPTHKSSIIMNIFIFIQIIYDSLCDNRKITIQDQAVQKMTEHNFSYVWIKKIFVPLQFSWFLNLYFLECPCNSRPYVNFVLIPFVFRNPCFVRVGIFTSPHCDSLLRLWFCSTNREQQIGIIAIFFYSWFYSKSRFCCSHKQRTAQ